MHLDIQVQPDGTLRFVDRTGQTVTTLAYRDLVLLLSLAHLQARPVLNELAVHGYDRFDSATNQLVRTPLVRSVRRAYTWLPDLSASLAYLEALNLVTVPGPQSYVWRGMTAELSASGARLARWLRHDWPGWTRYAQQFPV